MTLIRKEFSSYVWLLFARNFSSNREQTQARHVVYDSTPTLRKVFQLCLVVVCSSNREQIVIQARPVVSSKFLFVHVLLSIGLRESFVFSFNCSSLFMSRLRGSDG